MTKEDLTFIANQIVLLGLTASFGFFLAIAAMIYVAEKF